MKRNVIAMLSFMVLLVLLTATSASAQSLAKADVPFAFKVGQTQLAGGAYRFTVGSANNYITVLDNKTRTPILMSVARAENARETGPKLVFHRIGNQYFLAEIWGVAGSRGMVLPMSNLEKELEIAEGQSTPATVVIALR